VGGDSAAEGGRGKEAETPRSREKRPGARPAFFWVIAGLGAAAAAAQVLGAVWLFRYGPVKKVSGWRAAYEHGAWVVSRVDPKGPASGVLEEGDRLLAVDGDARAAAVGPFFRIRETAPGQEYELRVARRGEARAARLQLAAVPRARGELGYLVSLLLLGAAFLATSLVIGMLRPEDSIARWGAVALFLPSFTLLESATAGLFPSMNSFDAGLYLLIPVPNPFHLAVAFGFYSRFPAGVPRSRFAILAERLFFALGVALWIAEELIRRILAQAPLPASGLLTGWLPGLLALERLDRPFSLVAFAAICAAIASRMRRVVEPDQRRRMRWIAYGSLAGLVPWLLYSALSLAFASAVGSGWLVLANRGANLALVIVPIVTGFAIVKHRLFDINVVVRRTLQYLLARNVLTAATALAILAFGVTVYENRNRTVAEIFFHGTDSFALCVAGAALLLARRPLREWLDRRFFREAYDREKILVDLARDVGRLDSTSEISRHVSREIDAALHPKSIRVFQRDTDRSSHVLVYSSSEVMPSLRIADDAALLTLMEGEERPRDVPFDGGELPEVENRWLEELGVTLIVPMRTSEQRLAGLLLLGERRSEEPYGPNDRKLLSAIAGQMGLFYENSLLKGRVERDERYKRDVLSRFEDGGRFVKECPKCGACFGGATSSRCPIDGSELAASLPVDQTLLGRYRLDKLIGRGGMGAVYEAHDLRLGRSVAVKILVGPRFVNRASVRRFEREARASAKLNHPNIISVYDYGTVEGEAAFLVMELVRGSTLRSEIKRHRRLEPVVAAGLFRQILEGVRAAHAAGVVHRDIKPENILLRRESESATTVKILDFGLAKVTLLDLADPDSLTLPGTVVGTLGYMSPEQVSGGRTDARTDVFALGVLVVEMLTGRLPFRGASARELMIATLNDPYHLSGGGPEVEALDAVVQKCLVKDPSARYATVTELAEELLPALLGCPPFAPPSEGDGNELRTRHLK
jgi:hypothetical protein